jgi:serine/threonine protein kinase
LKGLILSILAFDPESRPSAQEILKMNWTTAINQNSHLFSSLSQFDRLLKNSSRTKVKSFDSSTNKQLMEKRKNIPISHGIHSKSNSSSRLFHQFTE